MGRLYEKHGHLAQSQELTPSGLAELCGRIALQPEKHIAEKGFVKLYEPTCGSGGLIFSAAELLIKDGHNLIDKLVVLASDINPRSVHMTYIQASMYDIPAVVTRADAITLQESDRWYTPAFILGEWVWRCPMNHTNTRHPDDEKLKMITHPIYAAIKQLERNSAP